MGIQGNRPVTLWPDDSRKGGPAPAPIVGVPPQQCCLALEVT